jgi:integrase/recombinase XerD
MEDQRKYLTEDELTRFFRGIASIRDTAIFTVIYWRGLRAAEAGQLRLTDWDRTEHRLFVHRGKGSVSGAYPLSPAENRALKAWYRVRGAAPGPLFASREGKGISRQMIFVLYREYAIRAGLPKNLRHPHCLKHSIGTHLAGLVDVMAIKDWLGHVDIRSSLVYSKFRSRERDKAAALVFEQLS